MLLRILVALFNISKEKKLSHAPNSLACTGTLGLSAHHRWGINWSTGEVRLFLPTQPYPRASYLIWLHRLCGTLHTPHDFYNQRCETICYVGYFSSKRWSQGLRRPWGLHNCYCQHLVKVFKEKVEIIPSGPLLLWSWTPILFEVLPPHCLSPT